MIAGLSEDAKYVGMYDLSFLLLTFTSWISFLGGINSLHLFSDFLFKFFVYEEFLFFLNVLFVCFTFISFINDKFIFNEFFVEIFFVINELFEIFNLFDLTIYLTVLLDF